METDNICGEEVNQKISMKILWIIYEIIVVLYGAYLTYQWYRNRQTFPLMERSPYLQIYFIVNAMMYLLAYPIFLQSDYLQEHQNELFIKCIFLPFQGSYTYIYLMKSCRLYWGFYTPRKGILKKYEPQLNYCFSSEAILIIICVMFLIFNILTGIIPSPEYNQLDFMAINIEGKDGYILIARMIETYFGLTYLFIALWLVRKVDKRVNIIYELYFIITCDLIATSVRHILMMTNLEIANNLCIQNAYPLLYMINWTKIIFTVYIGMVRPLKLINKQHQYFNSILVKKMKFFLFYRPDIFPKYIDYCKVKAIEVKQSNFRRTCSNNSNGANRNSQNSPNHVVHQIPQESNLQQLALSSAQGFSQNPPNTFNLGRDSNTFPSHQTNHSTLELFLLGFDYEFIKAHFDLYLEYLRLRDFYRNRQDKFEVAFKGYIQGLVEQDKIKYFKLNILQQQIRHWLNICSFTSGINRPDGAAPPNEETLSSSQIAVQGTLYNNNTHNNGVCEEDEFISRQQVDSKKIIKNIKKYSISCLEPVFNEYKMTYSYYCIKQEIIHLQAAYTNLLQIKMAVDQHMVVQ